MRIDRILIENLASLRNEQPLVDLESGELQDAGLIAITGATGAGKSTILDAVCLALFDRTPRLQGRQGQDPRELLSRGAGAAKVVVDLTLDDGDKWTAEWSVHRAYERPDGPLQASRQRLLDRTTGDVLADQKRAVRALVEARLGLSFEQFTGVILLAQGQFAKFLDAGDADRSELLERLTGTQIYSELGRLAFERHKELRQKVDAEEERLLELVPLAEEDRRRLEQEQDELAPHLARLEAQLQALEQQERWLVERRRLDRRLADARDELEQVNKRQAEADGDRQRLGRGEAAAALSGPLHRLDDARRAVEQAQTRRDAAKRDLAALDTPDGMARDRLRHLLRRLNEEHTRASSELGELRGFEHADAERLEAWRETRQTASGRQERRRELEKRLQAAREHLEQQEKKLADRRREARKLAEAAEGLREREQEAADRRAALLHGSSPERLAADRELLGQAEEVRRELDENDPEPLEEGVAGLEVELERARAETAASRALEESAKRELDDHDTLLKLAIEGAKVAEHRHLLREGEPCPLCGSTEHPFLDLDDENDLPSDERAALRHAHDRQASLRAEHRRQEQHLKEATAAEQKIVGELDRLRERARETRRRFQRQGSRWLELRLRLLDLPQDPFSISPSELGGRLRELETRSKSLEAVDGELTQLRERLRNAEGEHREAENQVTLVEDRQSRDRSQLAELERTLDQARDAESATREELEEQARALAQDCGLAAGDDGDGPVDPEALFQRIVEGRRRRQDSAERFRRLDELARSTADRGKRLLDDPLWPEDLPSSPKQVPSRDGELADLLRAALDDLGARLTERRLAGDRLDRAETDLEAAREQHGRRRQELRSALEPSPFTDEDELRRAGLAPDELAALRRRLEDLKLLAERRRAEHRRASADLEEHDAGGETLGLDPKEDPEALDRRLREHLRETREKRRKLADRSTELRVELEKDADRRKERERLGERLEGLVADRDRAARLAQLIGQKDGGKFRRFAQQLNLGRLLGLANRRLDQLAPRYALAPVTGSLELQVVDREMADERRPVSTLSGGESFLVSLALALALADLRRGRLRLGTLFLDEGFGSLDQETLDTALSTLEQLQADQATQILVISHVGVLQERIPHRIEVEKRGGGRSRLKIRVGDPA